MRKLDAIQWLRTHITVKLFLLHKSEYTSRTSNYNLYRRDMLDICIKA